MEGGGSLIHSQTTESPSRARRDCELQSILYGGRWWLPPSLGRGESGRQNFVYSYLVDKIIVAGYAFTKYICGIGV
jgi:hypothetical protein